MRRHLFSAMAVMCSQAAMEPPAAVVAVGSGGAGGILPRGNRDLDSKRRPSRTATPGGARTRRLGDSDSDSGDGDDESEDNADEENADEEDAADGEDEVDDFYGDDAESDDAEGGDSARLNYIVEQYDDDSAFGTIRRNFNKWAHEAEGTAWASYESPPSEWTSEQWDQFFGLLLGLCLTLCLVAACCACHFVRDRDEGNDAGARARTKAKRWGPKKSLKRTKMEDHRGEFPDDQYERYQDEGDDKDRDSVGTEDATVDTETDWGAPSTIGPQSTAFSTAQSAAPSVSTTAYEPPRATSLADYTSAQREKEARIFEAWKASRVELRGDESEYDDWKEEYDSKYVVKKNKASLELDAALAEKRRGEDRLLEAREFQHNLVGYYL